MTAAWSLEANKKIMDLLRVWYRSDIVQPILVALFAFQLLSGLRLLWAAIARRADIYSSIQTATAAYLVVFAPLFVISHLAMGLRAVLLGHGVRAAFANRLAWVICGIGLGVSLLIAIAQLSVRS